MSEAPNEIWCDTGLYYDYKTDWSEGSWRNNDNCGGVKYVRADRIEELEADNKGLRHMILDHINSTGDDPEIMAASRAEWAARAKDAEDKLARAVEALEAISSDMCEPRDDASAFLTCQSILAELKGGGDELSENISGL